MSARRFMCDSLQKGIQLQRLPLTLALKLFFSSGSNLRFGGRQSPVHSLAKSRLFPRFSSTRKNKSFLQYFATGSGTASCQDYDPHVN